MQNKDFHIKDILDYLGNKMSERDAYAFERRMEADPFLMDAVEGYQNMSPSDIEKELLSLRARIKQKKKARIVPVWMKVAAAVLILFGIGTLWMIDQRKQKSDLVSDRLEVQDPKVQKEKSSVLSENEVVEINSIEEINDEVQVVKEQRNVQNNVDKQPVKQPTTNKSFAQARSMNQELSVNDKKPLQHTDSMLLMEEESEDFSANIDLGSVEMDKVDKPTEIRVRGMSLLRDTSLAFFSGKVVDEDGIPLPGVSVAHSPLGGAASQELDDINVMTDADGNFEIKAAQSGAVLQLSFIGFKDKIAVAKTDSIGVLMMESDQMALSEVVVLSYGAQVRKRNANNTAVVKDEILKVESEDNILLPEPEGGVNKLVEKIERNLRYPDLTKDEKIKMTVELFVSNTGKVVKVQAEPQLSAAFVLQLENKLKSTQWTAPKKNGVPVKSSRKLTFEFIGED